MSRLRAHGAVLAILALGVFLRVAWIDQYPAFHPDEGFWGSGSKNVVLFGDAFLDNRLHPYLSPATFVALVGWFGALTPSLATARLFSAALGIATCVLVWDLARTLLPQRTWLPVLFFAVSGFVVLLDRTLLLEAHQTFWLVFATALLFAGARPGSEAPIPRRSVLFAGAAFGVALLVKTSSLYMIPAFIVAVLPPVQGAFLPLRRDHVRVNLRVTAALATPVLLFFLTATLVAAAGYGALFARDPERFTAAFRYEIEASHFLAGLQDPLLFHAGRFGLRPIAAVLCALTLARSDPFVCLLGALGVARALGKPRLASRAGRFFAVWALSGFVFTLLQINVTYRYFGTIAPALVFLAAFVAEELFVVAEPDSAPPSSTADSANQRSESQKVFSEVFGPTFRVFAFAGVFLGFHLARMSVGLQERPNRDYLRVVEIVSRDVPKSTGVLAAPYIGLGLPQKTHDFFRALRPYGDEQHPLSIASEIERRRVGVVIRDIEFRAFETPEVEVYLRRNTTLLARVGDYEVLSVKPDLRSFARREAP